MAKKIKKPRISKKSKTNNELLIKKSTLDELLKLEPWVMRSFTPSEWRQLRTRLNSAANRRIRTLVKNNMNPLSLRDLFSRGKYKFQSTGRSQVEAEKDVMEVMNFLRANDNTKRGYLKSLRLTEIKLNQRLGRVKVVNGDIKKDDNYINLSNTDMERVFDALHKLKQLPEGKNLGLKYKEVLEFMLETAQEEQYMEAEDILDQTLSKINSLYEEQRIKEAENEIDETELALRGVRLGGHRM